MSLSEMFILIVVLLTAPEPFSGSGNTVFAVAEACQIQESFQNISNRFKTALVVIPSIAGEKH